MGKVARIALPVAAVAIGGPMLASAMAPAAAGATAAGSGIGLVGGQTMLGTASASSGFFSGIGNFLTQNQAGLGLAARGAQAIGQLYGGFAQNELAQSQAKFLEQERAIRQAQIIEQSKEINDRRRRLVASVSNQLAPGGSKRVAIGDIDALADQSLRNVRLSGQADIASIDSDIEGAFLSGRSGLFGSFLKAGTTSLLGAREFGKARGIT